MHIFKYKTELLDIIENCINENGELSPDAITQINKVEMEISEKCLEIAAIIKNYEAEFDGVHQAKLNLQNREVSISNKITRLKLHLLNIIEEFKINHLKNENFEVKIKTNPPRVEILDDSLIDDKYIETVNLRKIKKADIRVDLIEGKKIQGTRLVSNKRVEIK